jgi:hypothetical protein
LLLEKAPGSIDDDFEISGDVDLPGEVFDRKVHSESHDSPAL